MNVTTWGELSDEWVGRRVIVRWVDGGMPLAEGHPSGMPHERRGVIRCDNNLRPYLFEADIQAHTSGFPAHALVQEEP